MSTIAELMVKLGVDDKDLDKGLEGVPGKLDKLGRGLSQKGARLSRTATLPILAAGAGLFALAGKQEEAEARLQSSYDSMNAAGWTTVDQLKKQASEFQQATTFGDEDILNFQSVLLTFGNVTGDTFTKATDLGLDMSAKLGTDLQSTAIQVGKALNDPVQGITALTRVGVSFTDQQKEQVKQWAENGDTISGQRLILHELEKQFGGTAEAMALTNSGQAKQAMNALGDAGEQLGNVLLPIVSRFAGSLKTLAERFQNLSPEAKEWVIRIGAVVAAVGPALFIGGKLISTFGKIGKAFGLLSKLMSANPWVLLIAATVALVVLIVKNWDKITAFLSGVWNWITETVGKVGQWFKDRFRDALEFVKNIFLNFTGPGLLIKHFDDIRNAVTKVKDWIVDKFNAAIDFLKGIPGKVTSAVSGMFQHVKDLAVGAKDWVTDKFNALLGWFGGLPGRITSAASGMWNGVKDAFRSAINWLIDKWNNFQLKIGGQSINLGPLGTITIPSVTLNTPNIPKFHDGGVFRAPTPGGEGLAVLKDMETVSRPGEAPSGDTYVINGDVYGWDDFVKKVRDAGVVARRRGWAA